MKNSITEILTKTASKSADFTYAHATLLYSEEVTTQTTIEAKLDSVLKFCDHIAYEDDNNVIHVIDLVAGAVEHALPIERAMTIKSQIDSAIVTTLTADYTYREHDDGGIDSAPTLTSDIRTLSLATGIDGGIEKSISNSISASIISGSDIIYDTANLQLILDRKKILLLREQITIETDGFLSYNIGDKLTYNTTFESGYIVIEDIKRDNKKLTTTYYGRGEYIGKPI